MVREAEEKPAFVPDPEQVALWPAKSGNEINGLGEASARRPTPIMWHSSDILEHGDLQDWFWAQGVKEPALADKRAERQEVIAIPWAETAPDRVDRSPEENTEVVKRLARESGAELVGIARVRPEWVFEGYDFDYPWVVVLGVAMDHEQISTAPEVTSASPRGPRYILANAAVDPGDQALAVLRLWQFSWLVAICNFCRFVSPTKGSDVFDTSDRGDRLLRNRWVADLANRAPDRLGSHGDYRGWTTKLLPSFA